MSGKVWVGDKDKNAENCEKIVALVNSDGNEVAYDGKSTILEALIDKGVDAPYSCQSGSCMACLGKVVKGSVFMEEAFILSDENIEAGECLTCQTYPTSKEVHISYDDV